MTKPRIQAAGIGREGQPLVTIDDFSADPDSFRAAAMSAPFQPASHHYPGIRAPLPADYLAKQLPLIASLIRRIFGRHGEIRVIDASFSMVTTPPGALSLRQRLPHCDAFDPERIAFIHYLMPQASEGTAFFRHRPTGYETVDQARRPSFFARLEAELASGDEPQGYIAGDTGLFERISVAEARYNRALLYPSFLLHSGAIARDAILSTDPAAGRLTVTGFLSVG